MSNQQITRRNHYVPQFYLKNWSKDGKTIWKYDIIVSNKKVPYWTQQAISHTAVWPDLYTNDVDGIDSDAFEQWINREFETPAKRVFEKVLSDETLSKQDWSILSHFVIAQYVRTPARLHMALAWGQQNGERILKGAMINATKELMKRRRKKQPKTSTDSTLFKIPMDVTIDRSRGQVSASVLIGQDLFLSMLNDFLCSASNFEQYKWQIIHAADGIAFPTSDDPVMCVRYQNPQSYDFRGGPGLKDALIIMPLSPKHLLFTQVGYQYTIPELDYNYQWSVLFRKMIVQHAFRSVYAMERQRGMLEIRRRIIDYVRYEREKREMMEWYQMQLQAEHEFWNNKKKQYQT